MLTSLFVIFVTARPVIQLDDILVEGEIRRPRVIQLEASRLPEKLEKAAVYNLIELEKRLLKPLSPEAFSEITKSDR